MAVNVLNRVVVVVGLSALCLAGQSVRLDAQSDKSKQEHQKKEKEPKPPKAAKAAKAKEAPQAQNAQQHGQGHLSPQAQQELIRLHEQRVSQYRQHLGQLQHLAQPHGQKLKQQKRTAQYRSEQQYLARLRQQQVRLQSQRPYDYSRDPYFYTPPSFRYARAGRDYQISQYGVDVLRRAVNYGYDEGRRAGLADRQDRWNSNYEDSYAYQDANYGYNGFYVDRDEYNNYFREGFRRGYEDGHDAGSKYGSYSNGKGTILDAILAAILNFQAIR